MRHLQHIADLGLLLERLKISQVIIAPGSRNAPLIQLFTGCRHFNCHSIVDERSAGYVALGMARQLGEPVVVVTTSGTAVLNLGPAMAEAFHQGVPLIMITADRPVEKIRQFNNQVIDQMAPFFNHSRGFYEFPADIRSEQELEDALSAVERLILSAVYGSVGPVHINVPMDEPLYEALPDPLLTGREEAGSISMEKGEVMLPGDLIERHKILVLAGMGTYRKEVPQLLLEITASLPCVVIAENISNLPHDVFIHHPELLLSGASGETLPELAPDLVIAFGGQVVSKRLRLFLESLDNAKTEVLDEDPLPLLRELAVLGKKRKPGYSNPYLKAWKSLQTREMKRVSGFMQGAPFSNLTTVQAVLDSVPERSVVHLGNSAVIRYSQLFPVRPDLTYFANRGTSGIDGCVSSAVGAAMVSEPLHLLLVGDLSFVYDSNALWNRNYPSNLKIIVLNDGGGGIFRLLEGPDQMEFFEEFSVTHHPVSLELLSQSFSRVFQRASSGEELPERLTALFQSGSPVSVLEVDTTGSENSRIFKQFFNQNR